jgi:hypothetical protein
MYWVSKHLESALEAGKFEQIDKDELLSELKAFRPDFEVEETRKYGHTVDKPKHSRIGVTTHNNGGFEVIESIEEIAKRIINAGNGLANIIKE